MALSVEDDRSSYDFDMDGTDDLEGLAHRRQVVNMDIEMEERRSWLLPLKTLMDVDTDLTGENGKPSLAKHQTTGKKIRHSPPSKARGPYRRYTAYQIQQLFELVIEEGKTAKDAALITGINTRTAQHYVKKYNDDEEKRLLVRCSKPTAGRTGKLTEEHSKFLEEYIDEHSGAVPSDIRHHLCKAFPVLRISISALHRNLVQKCKVTLKKLEKLTVARNSDRVVALRKEKVEEWNATPGLDFCKNCVFIDEAGFNLHTQRNHGRSRKGTPAKGTIPTAKGVTITILGAISDAGIIDISLRKPKAVSTSKKRKVNGRAVDTVNGRIGTRTEHYLAYLSNVMDVLDKNNMQGYYLVMDNAPIHTPAKVRDLIESRRYKCLYLPPYSPFLNPVEEFWSKVKDGVRRNALTADDRLSDRTCESVQKVTHANCQAWIRHAVSFFSRCELEETNLQNEVDP